MPVDTEEKNPLEEAMDEIEFEDDDDDEEGD